MAYFDMVEGSFKDGGNGTETFYPWGIFGRGYIISKEVGVLARRLLKVSLFAAMATIIALQWFFGITAMLLVCGLFQVVYSAAVLACMSGMPIAGERLDWRDSSIRQAEAIGVPTLLCVAVMSLLMTAGAIVVACHAHVLLGVSGALFFGISTVILAYQAGLALAAK